MGQNPIGKWHSLTFWCTNVGSGIFGVRPFRIPIFRQASSVGHVMTQLTQPLKAQPTVYIVDDDQATRKSLRWLVETLGVPSRRFIPGPVFSIPTTRPSRVAWCST